MTCKRAREFFERNGVEIRTEVNAKKETQGKKEALALLRSAHRLVAGRGTKVVEVDLDRSSPDDETVAMMLGPTGNLRAPTFRIGKTLYVGFPRDGFEGIA